MVLLRKVTALKSNKRSKAIVINNRLERLIMGSNQEQRIKGDNNTQQLITVNGNYNVIGLQREDVINLIQLYCYTDKEQIVNIVQETIESINEEDRKMPDKRVFVPVIQQLSYSLDDEYIKHTYRKLLKSSMNRTKTIHPSFVSIIGQLNSDEIKILNKLPKVANIPFPIIDIRVKMGKQEGKGIILIRNFSDIGYDLCDNPGNICAYIENLERLKLIEIPALLTLINKDVYTKLKQHPAVLNALAMNATSPEFKYEYDEKFFQLTQFGAQFINACSE